MLYLYYDCLNLNICVSEVLKRIDNCYLRAYIFNNNILLILKFYCSKSTLTKEQKSMEVRVGFSFYFIS